MNPLDHMSASSLLEALPDPALVIDAQGRILTGNSGANRLLASAQTPQGNIVDFMPEQERGRLDPLTWLRRWAAQPQAPELAHVRLWCRDAAGVEKPVRVRVGLLPGDPVSYLVTLVDVTEEQARQYRTRSAHRFAARVLAISADAIVNVDDTLHIVYANPSAEALFGYAPGSLVGQPLAVLLPESQRSRHETYMRAFAEDPEPSRLMGQRAGIAGLTHSGEEIPLQASITKVTTDRGLMFSAHLRDQRPLRAQEARLERSEARFRIVFEHARQAMALISPEGRVEAMNAAARRLLPREVQPVGEPFATLPFFSADPQGTAEALARGMALALSGETLRTSPMVRLPDGRVQHLDFTLSPVMTEAGVFAVVAEAHELPQASV